MITIIIVYVVLMIFTVSLCKAAGKVEPERCTGNDK